MATFDWPDSETVPALVLRDGTPLPPAELAALIDLMRSENPGLQTAVGSLRARCTNQALDAWMSKLLSEWLEDLGTGTARKIRWIVPATAVLGGDACAALLGPHLRGEHYNLRCSGDIVISTLVAIGTRGALLELAHAGRKLAGKIRGQAAAHALQRIADARGITPDQLQDRILPDGGLDSSGRRSFDYGPRQFEVLLDDDLMPVLRGGDGRLMTTLPKPNAKDDASLAADARVAWKVAKTQIQQTARWLAARFETAMITGETWTLAEFGEYFRQHPLARHVVRRLLWTTASPDEPATTCFRIAEDDTLADANDVPTTLVDGATVVRPVHPLQLEPGVRETWQRLFAEYQIVSPFPQLDRPVYRVSFDQMQRTTLTSFPNDRFDAKALVFPLENRGWARQDHADGGMLTQHIKRFPSIGMAACLDYEPGAFLGDLLSSGVQTLKELYFIALNTHAHRSPALPLATVPPIVFSETLRDIHLLIPVA